MEPQNNVPIQNNTPQPAKSGIGSIIGTIIIIAIIILGGLYFWGKRIEESKAKQDLVTDGTTSQAVNSSNSTNTSDDLNSIEAELNATNFDSLGSELNVELE